MHDARRMANASARGRALTHVCTYLRAKDSRRIIPARVCGERCVKWANLYLSDIEYSYRGAVGTDKSVYSVLRTYGASDCAIRSMDNRALSMHLGRLIGSHVDRARRIDRCRLGFPISYRRPRARPAPVCILLTCQLAISRIES